MLARLSRPFTIAATLISIAFGTGSDAFGNNYDRIDRIAVRIQKRSQQLIEESSRYRYTPAFGQMASEARLLRDTAIHIHDVTHSEGNLRQLKRDVALIDQAFYSLDLLVKNLEVEAARGYSRSNVNPRRARNLLNQIERETHNLSKELAEISRLAYKPRPQTYRKPVSNAYGGYNVPYSNGRSYSPRNTVPYKVNRNSYDRTALGFSIGGGSSRLWIGF